MARNHFFEFVILARGRVLLRGAARLVFEQNPLARAFAFGIGQRDRAHQRFGVDVARIIDDRLGATACGHDRHNR